MSNASSFTSFSRFSLALMLVLDSICVVVLLVNCASGADVPLVARDCVFLSVRNDAIAAQRAHSRQESFP